MGGRFSCRYPFVVKIIKLNRKPLLILLGDIKILITYSYYYASFGNNLFKKKKDSSIYLFFIPLLIQQIFASGITLMKKIIIFLASQS